MGQHQHGMDGNNWTESKCLCAVKPLFTLLLFLNPNLMFVLISFKWQDGHAHLTLNVSFTIVPFWHLGMAFNVLSMVMRGHFGFSQLKLIENGRDEVHCNAAFSF